MKSFFKPASTNSNVEKETNPVETTTSVEVPSKSSRSKETEIVNENQINLIAHLYFQKLLLLNKADLSSTMVCRI